MPTSNPSKRRSRARKDPLELEESAKNDNEQHEENDEQDTDHKETEEEHRLRVNGSTDIYGESSEKGSNAATNSLRRVSRTVRRELSKRQSSVVEALPETPTGWITLLAATATALLGYEVRLQKSLTGPPLVFGQCQSGPLRHIYKQMTATPDSILQRNIQPSLFVGTRGLVSSTAAYLLGGPSSSDRHVRFRQIIDMAQDGARLALDWELPPDSSASTDEERKQRIITGPIKEPVVLILHGINNDSSFGYVRSLMRTCTDRGWAAVGMNFRGCGGVPLTTPRGYNGAYTGDLRCVVQHIAARMADGVPVFLVGNSLGANLMTKYLGEEGLSETLPSCVAGGISLGNPLAIDSSKMSLLFSTVMALGAKKTLLENWSSLHTMTVHSPQFRSAIHNALLAVTISDFDEALAPVFARNNPVAPYGFRVGFKDGGAYWTDASSYRLIRHVSVPMLKIIAGDDFLVYHSSLQKLSFCVANPNASLSQHPMSRITLYRSHFVSLFLCRSWWSRRDAAAISAGKRPHPTERLVQVPAGPTLRQPTLSQP